MYKSLAVCVYLCFCWHFSIYCCLLVCLFLYSLYLYRFTHLSFCISIYVFSFPFICLSIQSAYLSINLSFCLSVYRLPSIFLLIFLFTHTYLYFPIFLSFLSFVRSVTYLSLTPFPSLSIQHHHFITSLASCQFNHVFLHVHFKHSLTCQPRRGELERPAARLTGTRASPAAFTKHLPHQFSSVEGRGDNLCNGLPFPSPRLFLGGCM